MKLLPDRIDPRVGLAVRWDRLATYNAECARGIVHTLEWRALMVQEQDAFDREQQPSG